MRAPRVNVRTGNARVSTQGVRAPLRLAFAYDKMWGLRGEALASHHHIIPGSSSGRTADSGSASRGSNPRPGATRRASHLTGPPFCFRPSTPAERGKAAYGRIRSRTAPNGGCLTYLLL